MPDGPWHTDVQQSMQPPKASASATDFALRFAGSAAQAVNKRIAGFRQIAGGRFNALLQRGRLAFYSHHRQIRGLSVAQKPGLAQNTGILRLRDAIIFDRNADIVTNTSAKGTDHMIYLHRRFPVQDFPFPVEAAEPAGGRRGTVRQALFPPAHVWNRACRKRRSRLRPVDCIQSQKL